MIARLRRQDGVSMVEVVVAALLVALSIGAVASLFITGNRSSLGTQRQSQLLAVAEQQIEHLRAQVKTLGFSALAMTSSPAAGSDVTLPANPADPNDFATSSTGCGTGNVGLLIEKNYNAISEGVVPGLLSYTGCAAGTEPLEISAGGFATPKQTGVAVGTGTASVYTYVTQTDVGCNSAILGGSCAGDARRVVVAVLPTSNTQGLGPQHPTYESTVFTNPVQSNQPNNSIGLTLGVNLG